MSEVCVCAYTVKNEYALSNQKNCGNWLQAILLIKLNKLELINSLKVNNLKRVKLTTTKKKKKVTIMVISVCLF